MLPTFSGRCCQFPRTDWDGIRTFFVKPLLRIAPLALCYCLGFGAQSNRTELRIHPVDESGNPVRLAQAEIYLDFWGGGERISVPADETGVSVTLDRSWLCSARPARCDDQFVEARLILQAEGYAPVVSKPFLWMGGVETPGGPPKSSVDIEFLSGAWMHLEQGESKQLTVPFRRPVERTLRFLNPAGQPVPGVGVRYSLLLASSNHCGSVEGELLAEGSSNEAGEFNVPDADAELAFEFTKAHHVLLNPQDPDQPMHFTGLFPGSLNTVSLREMERRPLHLQITGLEDVSGLTLSACMAACPCGACCGQIAESDAEGRIELEEFYPEEYERLTLLDRRGQAVWQSTPRTLGDGPMVIDLPKTSPVLSEPVPLQRR